MQIYLLTQIDTLTVLPQSDTYTIRNKPFWKTGVHGIVARKKSDYRK
jgi:hypothetical protein